MSNISTLTHAQNATILKVRDFSRKLVRELGFMRTTLADTNLTPSAVHAVLEIGAAPGISAKDLAHILRLDKSNASRQLAKLEASGFLKRQIIDDDKRSSALYLTDAGQILLLKIDQFATNQVSNALSRITPSDQPKVVQALELYTNALDKNTNFDRSATNVVEWIQQGYQPGCIGDIASLHARFYSRQTGFGAFFEKKVAVELSKFVEALPSDGKSLWLCMTGGRVLASLAIDGDLKSGLSHLRWFIVDEKLRGSGVGRQMLTLAMQFVDEHFEETSLWTFKGLDAARHLYESFGFRLLKETEGTQWGEKVIEQRFNRVRFATGQKCT